MTDLRVSGADARRAKSHRAGSVTRARAATRSPHARGTERARARSSARGCAATRGRHSLVRVSDLSTVEHPRMPHNTVPRTSLPHPRAARRASTDKGEDARRSRAGGGPSLRRPPRPRLQGRRRHADARVDLRRQRQPRPRAGQVRRPGPSEHRRRRRARVQRQRRPADQDDQQRHHDLHLRSPRQPAEGRGPRADHRVRDRRPQPPRRQGRRRHRPRPGFLYDGAKIIAELDGAGALVSRFVDATGSHTPVSAACCPRARRHPRCPSAVPSRACSSRARRGRARAASCSRGR